MKVKAILLAGALAAAAPALAQPSRYAVEIPAQTLDGALFEISRATGLQLLFTDRRITQLRAPRVSGQMTVREMLETVLAGTNYTYRFTGNRSIRIVPARRSAQQRAPRVTALAMQSQSGGAGAARQAADTAPNIAAPQGDRRVEEQSIVVTGSRIEGSSITDVLPVTVADRDYIDATGAVSGDELFSSLPQTGFVAFNESRTTGGVNDARGDVASINLRALGTGNTLVLINGRRMVLHPGTQAENLVPVTSVNTNSIPVLGVQRVEILRDGASAIYGADAVAGVINTILRDDFDGVTVQGQLGFGEGTPLLEASVSALAGFRFNEGRTRLSLFATYLDREGLRARDRAFSRSADLRPLVEGTPFEGDTDFDNRSTSTPFGVFQATGFGTIRQGATPLSSSAGTFHIQPSTNDGCRTQIGNGLCIDDAGFSAATDRNLRYDINDERSLLSDLERLNLFVFANHEFGGGIELFAEAGYYRAETDQRREQAAPLGAARITVPRDNYWNPFGPTVLNGAPNPNRLPGLNIPDEGLDLTITGYRLVDVGPRRIHVENESFRLLGGLRGDFGRWNWESAVLYSEATTDDTTANRVSSSLFQQALARSTPDAYNPFNGGSLTEPSRGDPTPNPQSVIDGFTIDVFRRSRTTLALADARISTPDLIRLPAGGLGVAIGVEARRESFSDDRDPRLDGTITYTDLVTGSVNDSDVLGSSGTLDSSGSRRVFSAFAEAAIPVIGPEMNVPLAHSVDIQLAARFESFSDVGDVLKPKVAVSWYPVRSLQLRGAWSQGFRAPNLPQVFERGVERQNTRLDFVRCEADLRQGVIASFDDCGRSQPVTSARSGNEDLEPEESENLSLGVTFQPDFLPGLTLTADYWRAKQDRIVGIFGDSNQIALDYLLRTQGSSNPLVVRAAPDADDIAAFAGTGLEPAGDILFVVDNYQNLLPREVEGLDFGLYYRTRRTAIGRFSFGVNAARLLTFRQDPSPEAQAILDAQAAGEIDDSFTVVGVQNLIEQEGRPKWRLSSTLTWRHRGFGAGLFASYIGAVDDGNANLADGTPFRIGDQFRMNAYVEYTVQQGALEDLRLRVGVRNLFDSDPPLADESFGYLGEIHSQQGRYWYFNVRKRF